MAWQDEVHEVRHAHVRASYAEYAQEWHLAVKHYLFCFERALDARDDRAIRFFAAKLTQAYQAMGLVRKAGYFRSIAG